MHSAIDLLELVEEFVSHLDGTSLARLARTFRDFYLPSLSCLWRNIGTKAFVALVNLTSDISKSYQMDIHQEPSLRDRWTRIRFYCPLIRGVDLRIRYFDKSHCKDHTKAILARKLLQKKSSKECEDRSHGI